jgi:MFS family permease
MADGPDRIDSSGAPAAPAGVAAPAERLYGPKFLAPLLVGTMLNPINSSILATALVPIARDLKVSTAYATSLVAVLYLSSAVAQPTAGKLSLRWGSRRVFIGGLVIVIIGSILGALAQNMPVLLVSRGLVGAGTSAAFPTAIGLIHHRSVQRSTEVPPSVMGLLAIAGQATAAIGLPLGGLLVGLAGWRWTLLVNVPVALAAIVATLLWLDADTPDRVGADRRGLDVGGIVLFGVSITALLLLLDDLTPERWWLGLVCAAGLGVLTWYEGRHPDPFIDVRMLARHTALRRTYARNALSFVGVYIVLYGVSQWFENARGLSPEQCGLALLPMILVSAAFSAVVVRLRRLRDGLVLAGGSLAVGGGLLALVSPHTPLVLVLLVTGVLGIGMGCAFVANQFVLYRQAHGPDVAVATGLLRTSSYIAAIGASSVIGFSLDRHGNGLNILGWVTLGIGVLVTIGSIADRSLTDLVRTS